MTTFDPARIFETLDLHGVDYVTIGAWAVIAHGYVRATADIDLMASLDKDNVTRLAAAMSALNARLQGVDAYTLGIDPTDPAALGNGTSFTMDTGAGPLDFLNDVPGADDYDQLRSRASKANAGGVAVWVVDCHGLISMKQASGRAQDLLDIEELRARRELRGD